MNIKLSKFNRPLLYKNKFKFYIWYLINSFFINTFIPFSSLKIILLKIFGAKIEKGVIINSKINVKYPWNLNIGYDCWLGNEVWLDNTEMVTIGNDCCISQGTYIVTGNHNFKKESFDYSGKEVNIGAHSWIGAKSIICPGANIKVGSFIKVGSIVK
tara:strand:- start:473 stop:943 length:471 start_codon:yes stop_codon:yes gene_type:complete